MNEDVKDRREEATEGIKSASDLIRDPSKLMIMAVVRRSGADYLLIRRFTGLSKGNLSNHLAKLEKSGMVTIGKHFEGKKPVTTVNLTEEGKETIEAYWSMMEKANAASREYDPERSEAPGKSFGLGEAYGGAASA